MKILTKLLCLGLVFCGNPGCKKKHHLGSRDGGEKPQFNSNAGANADDVKLILEEKDEPFSQQLLVTGPADWMYKVEGSGALQSIGKSPIVNREYLVFGQDIAVDVGKLVGSEFRTIATLKIHIPKDCVYSGRVLFPETGMNREDCDRVFIQDLTEIWLGNGTLKFTGRKLFLGSGAKIFSFQNPIAGTQRPGIPGPVVSFKFQEISGSIYINIPGEGGGNGRNATALWSSPQQIYQSKVDGNQGVPGERGFPGGGGGSIHIEADIQICGKDHQFFGVSGGKGGVSGDPWPESVNIVKNGPFDRDFVIRGIFKAPPGPDGPNGQVKYIVGKQINCH